MDVQYERRAPNTRHRGPSLDHPVMQGMEVVAHSQMNGHPDALQMQYQEVNGKHYLYVGHIWGHGVSILDVTDPAQPEVVGFIPCGSDAAWHIKVQLADGILMLPVEVNGFSAGGLSALDFSAFTPGVRVFDASDPVNPQEISFIPAAGAGVHRSWWQGGDYAYLAAGADAPGIQVHGIPGTTRILLIADVSDPANPRKAAEFWLPEQREPGLVPDGDTVYIHEPVVVGDRCYGAYWDGGFVILDVSDPTSPQMISRTRTYPELNDGNLHTCLPIPERNVLIVTEENTCNYAAVPKNVTIWDISDEEDPQLIATLPRPVPSAEEPWEDYVHRGDRFGPHCLHENYKNTLQCSDKLYLTYCNAGLRVYDISEESKPKEVAYFVPPDPQEVVDPRPYDRMMDIFEGGSRVACSQDVLVDPRGYIYLTGTNDGLWIIKETA